MGSTSIVFNLLLVSFTLIAAGDHDFSDDLMQFELPDIAQKQYYSHDGIDDVDEVYVTLRAFIIRGCIISLAILALVVVILLLVIQCCLKCSFCPAHRYHVNRNITPGVNNTQPTILVIPNARMHGNSQGNPVNFQVPPHWPPPEYSYFNTLQKPPEYQLVPTEDAPGGSNLYGVPLSKSVKP